MICLGVESSIRPGQVQAPATTWLMLTCGRKEYYTLPWVSENTITESAPTSKLLLPTALSFKYQRVLVKP